ncbi:winged helix-turn-helix transcriptional regulator [Yinghuangia aomiensis]
MKRTPFGSWPCSIARAVDLLGDWWTPLVLREAVFGSRRFEEFQRNLGIGRNVLAQRLNRLVDEGLMDRVPYQDRPLRHEYVLTAKGRDFFPVLAAIIAWGDTWLADDEGAPVVLRHRPCGHETHAQVVCAECGDALRVEDVEALAAPACPPGSRTRRWHRGGSGRARPRTSCRGPPRRPPRPPPWVRRRPARSRTRTRRHRRSHAAAAP